jgi:2-dehydropantoate 2-reductase
VHLISTTDCPALDVDLLIVFVKSSATSAAMDTLASRNVLSDHTVVLTLQGGLDNPDIIAAKLPNPNLLLMGSTNSFCKAVGPMTIASYGIEQTIVWPYHCPKDQEPVPRVREIVEECARSGLKMLLSPQAITDRWKMLLAYPTNAAVSAVCGIAYGYVWNTEEGKNLLIALAKEVALVAKLEGIDETLFNEEIAIAAVADIAQKNPDRPGTMLLDNRSRRVTEIDATGGALIRKARGHGVAVPCLFTLWSILRVREENYGNEYED